MQKTTVYLPTDLKDAVTRTAAREQIPEAEVIRRSIRDALMTERPAPCGGLFTGAEPVARRAEELLEGFGER